MKPQIAIAIMHVPNSEGRPEALQALLHELRGLRVSIASDRQRIGRWTNHKRALHALLANPSNTHVCVLPDDAAPVPGFAAALPRIVAARPNHAVTLFCARPRLVAAAQAADSSWARSRQGCWGWYVLPRSMAQDFLAWEAKYVPPSFPSDDARLDIWSTIRGIDWWMTMPSIIQQDESVPSTIGHGHKSAVNRLAIWLADDARRYDWTKGIDRAPHDGEGTLGKPSTRLLKAIRERMAAEQGLTT